VRRLAADEAVIVLITAGSSKGAWPLTMLRYSSRHPASKLHRAQFHRPRAGTALARRFYGTKCPLSTRGSGGRIMSATLCPDGQQALCAGPLRTSITRESGRRLVKDKQPHLTVSGVTSRAAATLSPGSSAGGELPFR
jgi:hypothetical protein